MQYPLTTKNIETETFSDPFKRFNHSERSVKFAGFCVKADESFEFATQSIFDVGFSVDRPRSQRGISP